MQSDKTNSLAGNAMLGALLGLGLWIALLLRASIVLRNEKTATYDITCGPFALNTLIRHQDANGIAATIDFHSGLAWYAVAWVLLGIVYGFLRRYTAKN